MFQLEETCRIIPTVETEDHPQITQISQIFFRGLFRISFQNRNLRNLRNLRIIVLSFLTNLAQSFFSVIIFPRLSFLHRESPQHPQMASFFLPSPK